jgi:hypothetical protein
MRVPGTRTQWSAVALLALAACGGDGDGGQPGGDPRLRGDWAADFQVASPLRLTDGAAGTTVRGEVMLMENHTVHALPRLRGAPSHYGTYGADFRGFGLPAPTAGRVPTIAARGSGADSVEMVMDGIGNGIVLTGRMESDTIAGRWVYIGDRTGGAQGTFVFRRPKD